MATGSAMEKTLYARVGGYDGIAGIVDEFLQTLTVDPRMARFANAMNFDSRKRNRQLTLDYLSAETGGPTFYIGEDMKTAHAGLAISASEWQAMMEHVERAVKKFKLTERESKEFLALISDLKSQIVER
jgi:hemoglobin